MSDIEKVKELKTSEFKKGELNLATVIALFRAKPVFKSFLKRPSKKSFFPKPVDDTTSEKEKVMPMLKTCAMTKTMGTYIQVTACFRIWKMKTEERIKNRKLQKEKEKSRRRQSLMGR